MIAALALAAALQSADAVAIRATDYALSMPAQIPSGLVTFSFENDGTEPHYVRFVRIGAGHTMDDFVAWQKAGGAIPGWLESSGGVGTLAPGLREVFTIRLVPGSTWRSAATRRRTVARHTSQRGCTCPSTSDRRRPAPNRPPPT